MLEASRRIFVREALAALEAGDDSDAQANQQKAELEAAARVSRLTQLWDTRLEQSATAGIASPRILSRLRPGAASASAPGVDQAPAEASHNAPVRSRLRQPVREGEGARDGAEGAPSGRWRKWARLDAPQSVSGCASLGYFVVGATNAAPSSADAAAAASQPTLARPAEREPCFYPGLEGDNALRGRIASFMDPPRCYAPIGGIEPRADASSERVAHESQPESDGDVGDDDEGASARQAEDEQLLSLLESQLGRFARRAARWPGRSRCVLGGGRGWRALQVSGVTMVARQLRAPRPLLPRGLPLSISLTTVKRRLFVARAAEPRCAPPGR